MKSPIRLLLFACLAFCPAAIHPPSASATEFSLIPRPPGPGHRLPSYWWHFNRGSWELRPPEGYDLTGGGELRLWKTEIPGAEAKCRVTTIQEAALLKSDDDKAKAEFVRALLPGGVTNVKLDGQANNPLPVNGLTNFSVTYAYDLGGVSYRLTLMVSQGGEATEQNPPVPGQPTPPPTPTPKPAADGKPVRTGEFFTTIIAAPLSGYGSILGAFQQLLAGAKVSPRSQRPTTRRSTLPTGCWADRLVPMWSVAFPVLSSGDMSNERRALTSLDLMVTLYEDTAEQSHLPVEERVYELCGPHYSLYDVSGATVEGLATQIVAMFAQEREKLGVSASGASGTPSTRKRESIQIAGEDLGVGVFEDMEQGQLPVEERRYGMSDHHDTFYG